MSKTWNIQASETAKRSGSNIFKVISGLKETWNSDLRIINFSVGDPTAGGILKPHPAAVKAVSDNVQSGKCNGYSQAIGELSGRQAVADALSEPGDQLTAEDIVLTSGCCGALNMVITAIGNAGDNILVPIPGFSHYEMLATSIGIQARPYNLEAERNWEVDLVNMESQIDARTKAIVVNNPSNPCGSVWSASHIREIIEIAERHCIPIISDEIYWKCIYPGHKFVSFSSQSKNVPVLSVRSISKSCFVPGWRLGWIECHDRNGVLSEFWKHLRLLSERILGPNSATEAALPTLLNLPDSFFRESSEIIARNAEIAYDILSNEPAIKAYKPTGSFYMMFAINSQFIKPELTDAMSFAKQLMQQQSVLCLPGVFGSPKFIRITLTDSPDIVREGCQRIVQFCQANTA